MHAKDETRPAVIQAVLLAAGLMVVMGGAAMSPVLPSIRDRFSEVAGIESLVPYVLTLAALFIAASAPLAGYLVDRIGRRRILLFSLGLIGLAGTSGYFAASMAWLLATRALVGIGVAGVMTSSTTLIADYFTGEARARMLGLQTGLMGIGGTLVMMISGVLADRQWNMPFLIHMVALLVLPFVFVFLHDPDREDQNRSPTTPLGEPGTCAGECAVHENPPLDVAAAAGGTSRLLFFIYLLVIFIQINFYIVPLYLPFYLGDLVGASAVQSGAAISAMFLSYAVSSIALGRVLARYNRISVITAAFLVMAVGYSLISLGAANSLLYVGLVIAGIGLGIMIPNLYVWLAETAPTAIRGRALGGFTTAVFLGQFLSPLLSRPLISSMELGGTLLVASGIFVVAAPLLFLGRTRLSRVNAAA